MRLALGVCYSGTAYQGWQSQATGLTIQDKLEKALAQFGDVPRVSTLCAGRTDAGVHGLMQVVHFDTHLERDTHSWVRGTNRYLPADIAVQWAQVVPETFHCRASATGSANASSSQSAKKAPPQSGVQSRTVLSPATDPSESFSEGFFVSVLFGIY